MLHVKHFGTIGGAEIFGASYFQRSETDAIARKTGVIARFGGERIKEGKTASFSTCSKSGGSASKRTGFALLADGKASTTRRKLVV
jgi:hypothetical protein